MSEMNEYEKLMYKKEKDKGFGCLIIVLVLIISFVFIGLKDFFMYPDTVKDTVNKGFSNGEPYPPVNTMIDHGNGWVVLSVNASNQEDALLKLRKTYIKLSKKISTKKVDKIMIAVYEYSGLDWGLMNPYQEGSLLFTSNILVKDIKSTNWKDVRNYEEFKQKANID